ncbi:hypothetical protein HPB47_000637 [Ixodes persulcatus]|uniref:Uncharacterized protein n=1 Tax=Ixodes persulcatus TaxID=34615 RepID=A0AC60PR70_IXOPE|nr:hypothetical protein HPB47_000637 [Ixodes persulcatus]
MTVTTTTVATKTTPPDTAQARCVRIGAVCRQGRGVRKMCPIPVQEPKLREGPSPPKNSGTNSGRVFDGDWFPVYDHAASREDRKCREKVAHAGDGVKASSPWVYIGVESGASVHTRQPFPLRPRFDPRRGASFRSFESAFVCSLESGTDSQTPAFKPFA